MNREMARIQDDYIERLRRSMVGLPPDSADEVEREIRNHIEDALADRGEESVGALNDALERLGPPEEFGSDLGLYLTVDRGYREWSVPHMVRSTAFWSMGTAAGAVAFVSFGILFALSVLPLIGGLAQLAPDGLHEQLAGAPPSIAWPERIASALVLSAFGLAMVALVTALVRWFVGEYVRMARPHTLGGPDADPGWTKRASRRIKILAACGLAATFAAWLILYVAAVAGLSGSLALATPPSPAAGDPSMRVLAVVVLAGMAVFLLSPILGLVWTRARERRHVPPDANA